MVYILDVFLREKDLHTTIMKIERYFILLILVIPVLILRDFTPNNELKYLSIVDEAIRNAILGLAEKELIPLLNESEKYRSRNNMLANSCLFFLTIIYCFLMVLFYQTHTIHLFPECKKIE